MRLAPRVIACTLVTVAVVGPGRAADPPLDQRLLAEGPAALAKAARAQGDPQRGALLFHQPHLSCTKCHACGGKSSPLGPDLAHPEAGTTDAAIVESVLVPSKVVRKGYESVILARTDGRTVSGLLAEDRKDAVVLRDPAQDGQPVVVPRRDVVSLSPAQDSLMPAGLANLLADRQQFLDLASYLFEAAEFGPARARSLRPDPTVLNPPLPAYEHDLDHAGLIAGLDERALRRGEVVYQRLCGTCHGTKDQPGSMPTSPRFASGPFKNGSDPFALYQTLTRGYGLMAPQAVLAPRQKYDVIHYIREAYLKESNPSQYVRVDDAYLARLPKGTSRGPVPADGEPWLRADYGPTLTGTFEAGTGGKNMAYKGVAVRLDPGPGGVARGRAWVVFEHDTLRVAAGWTGRGFIDWNGINFNGRHDVHPRVVGRVAFETPAGPGWADPETGRFDDPRLRGRDDKSYGPLPRRWGHYRGLYRHGDQVVFAYTVGRAGVRESPALETMASGDGRPGTDVFPVTLNIDPVPHELVRRVASRGTAVALVGDSRATLREQDGFTVLHVPAGDAVAVKVLLADGDPARLRAYAKTSAPPADLKPLTAGGPRRWPEVLTTPLVRGADDGPFAVDTLTLPTANPWQCQVRLTGLDFDPDGRHLVACTWDGDVWRVGGLDPASGNLTWRRIASGLFQPLGLKIVGGQVYVGCRDQIVVLRDPNGDGETDFYECFNSDHQVTEHFHEFAMGLQTDAAGNFYYAKSARHAKTALVPHHGTLLRVSPDGSRTDILATGFRAANGVCVNPDGTFFVTDQEGHWTPKNRINWVRPGRFHGNLWGYHDVTDRSDAAVAPPVCWITNRFDRSPAELVRVEGRSWGRLNGSLLNLSYGHGKVYVVPHETVGGEMQGGMCALPLPTFPTGIMRGRFRPADGHLYACGMYSWAGNQQAPGGLYRLRATGKPAYLPVGFQARPGQLALTFSDPLAPGAANDPRAFGLKVWSLRRSERYGSPHLNEQALKVADARLSEDRRTVVLVVPDLRPTQGLEVWYSVTGADGREVDGLLHGTIHRLEE